MANEHVAGGMSAQREPDWKQVAQASMQQRDEANRNLCNLQIEMAILADKLKKFEDETGVIEAVPANNGADKPAKITKPVTETSH